MSISEKKGLVFPHSKKDKQAKDQAKLSSEKMKLPGQVRQFRWASAGKIQSRQHDQPSSGIHKHKKTAPREKVKRLADVGAFLGLLGKPTLGRFRSFPAQPRSDVRERFLALLEKKLNTI